MPTDPESPMRLTRSHIQPAAALLARAFAADPLYRYLFPDPAQRDSLLLSFFNFRARFGILYGEVYATSPALEGIVVWLPSSTPMNRWRLLRSGGFAFFTQASAETRQRMSNLMQFTSEMHHRQAPFPHWHLSPVAVDPAHQGKGLGGKLLRATLDQAERQKLPCFLETQSERNVAFYRRYGFEVVEVGTIPGTDLSHWTMLRQPGG